MKASSRYATSSSPVEEMDNRGDTPDGVQRPRNQQNRGRPSSTMPLETMDGDTHRLRDTSVTYGRSAVGRGGPVLCAAVGAHQPHLPGCAAVGL